MSGVCPKCVAIRDDGAFCEECGVRLVSTGQWKQDRDTLLNTDSAGHHNQQPDSFFTPPIQPRSTEPQNTATAEEKKDFVLGFFIGALLFFLALITSYYIFGDLFS